MDWFDQVDELWRARGSVGEFDSAEEFRALLHVLIGHGNYEVVFDDSSRVCGFVSWLWVDDLSLDLLNAFGGWRNVYQLAIPLYGGRNLFVMHFISSSPTKSTTE